MDFPARIDKLRAMATRDPSAYTKAVLELSAEIDAQEAHEHMVRTAPDVVKLVPSPGAEVTVGGAIYPDMTLQVESFTREWGPSPLRRALNTVLGLDPKTSRAELLLGPMSRGEAALPGLRSIDAHGRGEDGWSLPPAMLRYENTLAVRSTEDRLRGIRASVLGVDPATPLTPGGVSGVIEGLLARGVRERGTILVDEATYRALAGSDAVIEPAPDRHAKRTKTDKQAVAASIARAKRTSDRRREAGAAWSMRWQRDVHAASDLLLQAASTGDEAVYQGALRRASVRINVARDAALSVDGVSWVSQGLDDVLTQVRSQFGQSVHFAHLHWPAAPLAPWPAMALSLQAQLSSRYTQPLRGDQPSGDDDGPHHP